MTYCHNCNEVTNDKETRENYNKKYSIVFVHCEKCGLFKFQYLEEKKDDKI